MKNFSFIFVLFISSSLCAQFEVALDIASSDHYDPIKNYLLADDVALRDGPNKSAKAIASLPIGTDFFILKASTEQLSIKGITSPWYYIKTSTKKGWIWGGLIAKFAMGSNEDASVKFLMGYSHAEKVKDEEGGEYFKNFVQIRVVKGGQQIDKLVFPLAMAQSYLLLENIGRKGVEGVDDILQLHIPCIGGCGCTTGDQYIFWNGHKLVHAMDVLGTADAWASEGAELIFPSDMEGEEDYIKLEDDSIDWEVLEKNPDSDIVKRILTTTYFQWTGNKLELADKPAIEKIFKTKK